MAEMDMKLDTAPSFTFDGDASNEDFSDGHHYDANPFDGNDDDEDLIDYDIDTTEKHHLPTAIATNADQLVENPAPDVQAYTPMNLDTTVGMQTSEAANIQAIEQSDLHDLHDDLRLDEIAGLNEDATNLHPGSENALDGDVVFDEQDDETLDTMGFSSNVAHNADDEITYEDDDYDASTPQEAYKINQDLEHAAHEPEPETGEDGRHQGSITATTRLASETPPAPQSKEVPESAADAEQDEITWEQEDGQDEGLPSQDQPFGQSAGNDANEAAQETQDGDSETRSDMREIQNDGSEKASSETEHLDDVGLIQDEEQAAEVDETASNSGEDYSVLDEDSEAESIPFIPVLYRGDTFPLFSSKPSEGFFTDSYLLELDMASLLYGFREEVGNELADDDVLVFHIDELGLEFAETDSSEHLSGITLKQILEVFDSLVKNEDSDPVQTLSAKLFTKPGATRRFEFLTESVAAGKGLSETVFELQQVRHDDNPSSALVEFEGFGYEIVSGRTPREEEEEDAYESFQSNFHEGSQEREASTEAHKDQNAEMRDEEQEAKTEEEKEAKTGEEKEEKTEEEKEEKTEEEKEEKNEDENEEKNEEENEVKNEEEKEEMDEERSENENLSGDLTDYVKDDVGDFEVAEDDGLGEDEDVEEYVEEETEKLADKVEGETQQDVESSDVAGLLPDPSHAFVTDPDDFAENGTNPFTEWMDEDEDEEEDEGEHASTFELEEIESVHEPSDSGDPLAKVDNSPSTHTLSGESNIEPNRVDGSVDPVFNPEATEDTFINNDDLAEIDWRDGPDMVESNEIDAFSGATKRARPDDELDVEEEQDVKRRRS